MTTQIQKSQRIEICNDGVWAGAGKLTNGSITDVPVQWCDDTDESENVYEEIEEAIENGESRVTVELADGTKLPLSWTITEIK